MDNKESFYRQIELEKQKIANEKIVTERKNKEESRLIIENKQRELERQRQEEIEKEKITRSNFVSTGIIEILEEVRDNKILIYEKTLVPHEIKNIFGKKTGYYSNEKDEVVNPISINYKINSVSVRFDHWLCGDSDTRDQSDGGKIIKITKNNNSFKLDFQSYIRDKYYSETCENIFTTSSNNPTDIISSIAKIVVNKQIK